VDESTTGAGERIAAFAQERKLAPVVGARTAGRLICCSVYKVGYGYFVRIPARAWYTWSGELLEEKGVVRTTLSLTDISSPRMYNSIRQLTLSAVYEVLEGAGAVLGSMSWLPTGGSKHIFSEV